MEKANKQPRHRCPHCQKTIEQSIRCHYIEFCPHCKNSVLVNPFTPDLEKMAFGQFALYFIQTKWKLFGSISVFLFAFFAVLDLIDKKPFENWQTLAYFLLMVALILLALGIYVFEKKCQNPSFNPKNKAIKKGVDRYDTVKDDFKIAETLESLKDPFDAFAVFCPACRSQRLHRDLDGLVCQNCRHRFKLSRSAEYINKLNLPIYFLGMMFYNTFFNTVFGLNTHTLPYFLVFLFLSNLIVEYFWYKIPKWQEKSL